MKKILFVLATLLTVSVTLNAQSFDKKNIYVGGTVGFTSTSQSNDCSITLSRKPNSFTSERNSSSSLS